MPVDPDKGVDSIWWVWSACSKGLELRVLAAKGAAASPESFTRLTGEIRAKLLQSGSYSTPKEELVTATPRQERESIRFGACT